MQNITTLKPFEELAHTDEIVRLDWFGGVESNIAEHDNPLLECFFTPLRRSIYKSDSNELVPDIEHQFRSGIAVGYLPGLFIGQCFRSGKLLPQSEWLPSTETIVVDMDIPEPSNDAEIYLPQLGLQTKIVPFHFYPDASKSGVKRLQGKLIKSTNSNKKTLVTEEIIISEIELIRYYLTNSSFSCKKIFTNAFGEEELPKKVFNIHIEEEERKENPDRLTGKLRMVYRHGYTEKDAPILARIRFSPNGIGLKAARRVFSSIVATRINNGTFGMGYPRTNFPFTGKTRMTITGKRYKTNSGFIFLAHRIHSCSSPFSFPFSSLSFSDEVEPGGNPAPPGSIEAFPNVNPRYGPTNEVQSLGTSQSNERPKSGSLTIHPELCHREYPGLSDITIIREKLRDSTFSSSNKIPEYDEQLINASTGVGTSGSSSSVRQSLSESIEIPQLPTDLKTFVEIINELRTLHQDWKLESLLVGSGTEIEGEWSSYFPKVPCAKRRKMMRIFSYLDDEKFLRRSFMCVQVRINNKYLYLFEAQRRLRTPGPGDQAQTYKEELPVLLVYSLGLIEVKADDFLEMIKQTVIEKTWPSLITGLKRDYTIHGMGAVNIDDMAARIGQLIARNLEITPPT